MKEDIPIEFEDPVIENQRSEAVTMALDKFKKEALDNEELRFIEIFLELAQESGKVNISETARLMGITADKGHNIFKKIKRKFLDFIAKHNLFIDLAASALILDLGLFDFIRDLFEPEESLDEELLKAGNRISNKILDQLGLEAIGTLSKIIK